MGRPRNQRTAGGGVLLQKGLIFSLGHGLGFVESSLKLLPPWTNGGQEFFLELTCFSRIISGILSEQAREELLTFSAAQDCPTKSWINRLSSIKTFSIRPKHCNQARRTDHLKTNKPSELTLLTSAATSSLSSRPLRRIDLTIKPYMESDDGIAIWQIASTIIPLILCCIAISNLTNHLTTASVIFTPILFILIVLFLSRSFSLMHDCGHHSLFRSKAANRIAAFLLSIVHAMPHHPWSRGHAFHHQHNGNWNRYRGPSALTTLREYETKNKSSRFTYQLLRHPLTLLPGGFYYLVIKPRVALLLGFIELIAKAFADAPRKISAGQAFNPWLYIKNHKSSFFYTKEEVYDTIANSICVALAWWWIGSAIGYWHFWILYASIMSVSAAIMIAVFFVQHNFPGSYASGEEGWSYFKGAIEGSSFLIMPPVLNWFTADIAYHHIHHLSERIPNYRLRTCHEENKSNFDNVTRLQLHQLWKCFSLILWDEDSSQLASVKAAVPMD